MSYTPTNWSSGDVITAANLNKAEAGIESAQLFIVTLTSEDGDTFTADKTFAATQSAYSDGMHVVFRTADQTPMGSISESYPVETNVLGQTFFASKVSADLNGSNLEIALTEFTLRADDSVEFFTETYSIPNATPL